MSILPISISLVLFCFFHFEVDIVQALFSNLFLVLQIFIYSFTYLFIKIIVLSDDDNNEGNSSLPNDLSPSKHISSNKKRKLNAIERAEREKERLRRSAERRIKAEKLLAAKELRLRKKVFLIFSNEGICNS